MTDTARSRAAWTVLRVTLAVLIAIHGWARFFADAVTPFAAWLDSLGLPGPAIAWGITALEILGTPLYALGIRRLVLPLSLLHAAILTAGIVMVHAPAGWFVVGLGRNGVEYSVLLIVALLCVGLQHAPRRPASAPAA